MMKPFLSLLTALLTAMALLPLPALAASKKPAPVVPLAPPVFLKPATTGTFQDAQGTVHPWSIGPAHGLTWDSKPYLPVGAAWTPRSWSKGAGEAEWSADKISIDAMSKRGVQDVLLTAGTLGLTHVPPVSVQRVLDSLDAKKFGYGLRIADFPKDPLIGYVVKPAVYRNPSPPVSGPTLFQHIPNLADAFYLLVSPRDADIEEIGDAQTVNGETASVTLKTPVTGDVLLLYPQRLYLAGTPESRLPDLWQGYDEYRDRLLQFFKQVHLGPGFRFYLDPLTDQLGLGGEVENVIPTTDGFRLDFEAWLNKKYNHNVDDLNRGWGIKDRDLPDFATAARCLPLWSGSKGVPAVYDPVKKTPYRVLNRPRIGGHVWDDLAQFRIESVRGYMNALADVLKKGVADAPVIYAWGDRSALWTNPRTQGGFDGLAMTGVGSGAYAFAQAEEAAKTTWLLALSPSAATPTLIDDWDGLKKEGARGFFAPAVTDEEVRRLGAYNAALSFQTQDLLDPPRVLPYPAGVPDLQVGLRRLSNGVWWLPSYSAGAMFRSTDAFTLGPELRGYRLNSLGGYQSRFVVWSPHGTTHEARFPFPKDSPAVITDAAGVPLKIDKNRDTWTVPVGRDPIIITRIASVPLPVDAAEAAEKEATRLIKYAKSQGIPTQLYEDRLFGVHNTIADTPQNADLRYNAMVRILNSLSSALQPFVWIEAERATTYTFDSLVSDSEASGGSYMALDTTRRPPATTGEDAGYRASYKFPVNASGTYALWIAATPVPSSSPLTYTLDDGAANPVQDVPTEGGIYAGQFLWSHIGDVTLARGPHTLTLTVADPRPDGRYVLSVDALCLSRAPFHPNGTEIPTIDFQPPPTEEKDKKKKKKKPPAPEQVQEGTGGAGLFLTLPAAGLRGLQSAL